MICCDRHLVGLAGGECYLSCERNRTACLGRGCSAEAAPLVPAKAAHLLASPNSSFLDLSHFVFNQRSPLKSQQSSWASAIVNPCCLSRYYIKFRLISLTFLILNKPYSYSLIKMAIRLDVNLLLSLYGLWTANEGPVRIQFKCLVPIYVFPEMKMLFPKQNSNVLSHSSYTHYPVRD